MKRLLLFAVLLLYPAFLRAQTVSCQTGANTGTTTVVASFSSQGAGGLVFVSTRENTDNTSTWTLTDSASQTYTQTTGGYADDGTTNNRMDARWKSNSVNITSVTATFPGTMSTTTIIVCFVSGITSATPIDTTTNSALVGFGTSISSNTAGSLFTTTNANDILFYVVGTSGGVTSPVVDTGYTLGAFAGSRHPAQYKIVSSIQTSQFTTLTWTSVAKAEGIFVAFKLGTLTNRSTGASVY